VALALVVGCGKEDASLTELSPEVEDARDRLGPQGAVAKAKAEAEKEDTAAAWERLAQSYTLTDEPDKAIEALQKALERNPDYPRAVVGLTQIRMRQGKPDEAETLVRRIVDENGDGPAAAQLLLARALMYQDQLQEALDLLNHAVKSHPDYPALEYTLGDAQLADDRPEDAVESYTTAVNEDPSEPRYHRGLIRAYLQADDTAGALRAAREATEQLPDNAEMWFLAGTVRAREGKIQQAVDAYEEAMVINPNFVPAANNLAVLLADENMQLNRAQKLARQAVRSAPQNHAFADTYGWVLVRAGEYEEGIELLRMVHENWSDSPAVKWHLGYGLVKSGQMEEGRKLVVQAAAAENRPDIASAAQELLDSMDQGG
jgi:predicted Zn-dependent protease